MIARPPAVEPVKPTAWIGGRVDERLADLDPGGEQVGERAVGQAGVGDRGADLAGDELARARVRRVALDHDGAAGGERGGGVAAGGGEGEREVARAEHGDRPDRDEHAADVGARDRLGVGVGRVEDRLDVVARVEQRRRTPRAGPAVRSSSERRRELGQPGLGLRRGHDLVAGGAEPLRRAAEHRRTGAAVAQRGMGERLLRRGDRGLDVRRRGLVVRGAGKAGPGIDGVERGGHAVYSTGSVAEPVTAAIGPGVRGSDPLSPLHEPQRYERIADRIAGEIRAGRLAPGERLPGERELARRLEVGRASVREAIGALQLRGVLETRPGAGSYVAADALELLGDLQPTHDAGPFDVLEARLLLEPGVAALAARRGRRDAEAEAPARRDGPRPRRRRTAPAGTTATAASTAASPPSPATPSCSASPTRSPP